MALGGRVHRCGRSQHCDPGEGGRVHRCVRSQHCDPGGCTVWEVTALLLWGFTGMGGHSTMALGMYRWRKSQCCDPEGCAGIEVTASPLVLVF